MLKKLSRVNILRLPSKQSIDLIANYETIFNKNFSKTSFSLVNTLDASIFDIVNNETKKIRAFTKEWEKLMTKAEKSVGYPTSFLNLRYLVSDEVANVASLLRKLMKTSHPLIKTAKKLINEPNKYNQMNGLIVLLVSKTAGLPKGFGLRSEISDGIHRSQRQLAEICEMINMASIIHKGIVDYESVSIKERNDMENGNKIAILCGDYLLASACTELAKLKNTQVVDIMSQVIADISQSVFEIDDESKKITFLKNWYKNLYGSSSSLLANSCKAAAILVDHSFEIQNNIWLFANNFDITHKIWIELNQFKKANDLLKPNSLINAIYNDKYNGEQIDADVLFKDCLNLFDKHFNESVYYLSLISDKNNIDEETMNTLDSILNLMKLNLDLNIQK